MSSFAEEFVFCQHGYLGPKQLRSQMSSFAVEFIFCKSGHLGPQLIWS